MKKIIQILITCITLAGSFACTNNTGDNPPDEKKGDTTKKTSQTSVKSAKVETNDCDYYVDSTSADKMIKKFDSDFYKAGLTKQFWIEKCVLVSIKTFLDNNQDYDGIRFFLGQRTILPAKSSLLAVPTMPSPSPTASEKHSNQWGVPVPLSCAPSQLILNIPVRDAINFTNLFGKTFRYESTEGQRSSAAIDQLSIGVWISRCKINALYEVFKQPSTLDGLMAISAAYFTDDQRRAQGERKYVIQSTLIFVPTERNVLKWNTVKPPKEWADSGGYNHGELCPQICN